MRRVSYGRKWVSDGRKWVSYGQKRVSYGRKRVSYGHEKLKPRSLSLPPAGKYQFTVSAYGCIPISTTYHDAHFGWMFTRYGTGDSTGHHVKRHSDVMNADVNVLFFLSSSV